MENSLERHRRTQRLDWCNTLRADLEFFYTHRAEITASSADNENSVKLLSSIILVYEGIWMQAG